MKINKKSFYKNIIKHVFILFACIIIFENNGYSIQIERTAETAAAAKTSAINDARRTAFAKILQEHISENEAKKISEKIMDNELATMIYSISIENEKSDATNYSADIAVDFDEDAVNKWLANNGIGKITEISDKNDRAPIFFELNNIYEFSKLMHASRETSADLKITVISGERISANVRVNAYQPFVSLVRNAGITISY